ncbi:MAG TPA: FAD/NAD(P)-binding protein, partial [Cellvibrio sp.]|nr:FAD/NAD(P)-binding protein [Cellvibrio sp.]
MPNTLHRKKLVIVGCGAAATLLLADLSSRIQFPLDIYILDDNTAAPAGLAYAVNDPAFVLNVAAKRMGAYIHRPDHFYQWLLSEPEPGSESKNWRNLHPDF